MGLPRSLAILLAAAAASAAVPQSSSYQPPTHKNDWPGLVSGRNPLEQAASLNLGPHLERNRSAAFELAEHRRLTRALAALAPQRKGVVDAYVLVAALDSDPVFGREAREAAKVLARRYDGTGRTLVLAGTDGSAPSNLPMGSPRALSLGLARIAELMDVKEDVLVLYTTSHGTPKGIAYHDGNEGYGIVPPSRLASLLAELGISNRLLILSACYSGIFLPQLATDRTAIVTAASADRTSFGCAADNDWTYFGDALLNQALRKPQPFAAAVQEAQGLIGTWEAEQRLVPSAPRVSIGPSVDPWLKPLEARIPKTVTQPVGRPAAGS